MIDLEKIRERWARVAPNRWYAHFEEDGEIILGGDGRPGPESSMWWDWTGEIRDQIGGEVVATAEDEETGKAIAAAPADIAALIEEVERMRAVVQGVRNMMAAEEDVETLLAEGAELDSEEVWHARDTLQGEALATYEALARLDANDE